MCRQTIVLTGGATITGILVEHLGGGRVTVDVDGKRYAGHKIESVRRATGPHAAAVLDFTRGR